ncbi:MAG: ribosome silencing factor [Defluviitaleaceae bacterium]|nr:ribosome silencing factor [Defluviitaleaceae bacterium]
MNKELQAVTALKSALEAKFAHDLLVLDLSGISPIADYFVIATAGSAPQMAALAEVTEETLKAEGFPMLHMEGVRLSKWVLLDYGAIIIHIFDKESREYYNIERTWGDAKIVEF